MSNRLALILLGVWTVVVLASCGGGIWFVTTQVPRREQEARAQRLGSVFGIIGAVGYGAIMLPWAVAWRNRRDQRAQEEDPDEEERPRRRRRKRTDDE